MSRMVRAPVVRPGRVTIVVLLLAAALGIVAGPAPAGIRDLAKSAKDKATGKKPARSQASAEAVTFDDTTLELTGELLDRLIAGRKAAQPEIKDRPALARRREAILDQIAELNGTQGGAIAENHNQRAEVENCRDMKRQEIRDRKMQEEMARQMANPRSAEKIARLSLAMSEAQARGDTAEYRRVGKEVEQYFALTRADSLEAANACGPLPALHPARVKLDALEKELATLEERLRTMDQKAIEIQVEKCGMNEKQIAMAWERIELYLAAAAKNPTPGGFGADELDALAAHKGALEAALKT